MKINPRDKLTSTQTFMIVSKSMIGSGILILPQGVAKDVGTPDGWISVIISGVIALLIGYVIIKLSQRFPKLTFFQFSQLIAGKYVGILHGIIFVLYVTLSSGYLLRVMGEVIRMYLLDSTPIEVIMIAFLSVAAYLTLAGINPIARLNELFFPVFIISW
ncbi:GerAB/ArcD/ProY family transporter [Paenibacillus sp. N3.4]|nr:GerAB/ArcD/ProY family transporter [Paenibacillus sp. N3.4]